MTDNFESYKRKRDLVITKILDFDIFKEFPLVLLDLGASGDIYHKWEDIKTKSIFILCDADKRDFGYSDKKVYRIIKIRDIISDNPNETTSFYLTKSPYCSSTLEPDLIELRKWSFYDLFEIKKRITLKSISLNDFFDEVKLNYIDWYKSDTQGTDLRIFKSLRKEIRDKVLLCEFEPGIMKSYKNEDPFAELIAYMSENGYWLENIEINGAERINLDLLKKYNYNTKNFIYGRSILKTTPGWANLSYLKELNNNMNERDLIVLFLFSFIEEQYGFCLEIIDFSKNKINKEYYNILKETFFDFFNDFINYSKKNKIIKKENIIKRVFRKIKKLLR